jgi:hypothetical protein
MASIIEALHGGSTILWAGAFGVLGLASIIALILHIPFIARFRVNRKATKKYSKASNATPISTSLKNLDKKTYRSMSNCFLKDNAGKLHKFDHILLSKFGIFIIAFSDLQGVLRGSDLDQFWYQLFPNSSQEIENPVPKLGLKISMLSRLIGSQNFVPIICFSDEVFIQVTSSRTHLVLRSLLPQLITNYRELVIPPSQIETFYSQLYRHVLRGKRYELLYEKQEV